MRDAIGTPRPLVNGEFLSFKVTAEVFSNALLQHCGIERLAFPYDSDFPPKLPKLVRSTLVALNIALKLLLPYRSPGLGARGPSASRMAMPKAPMDEDHLSEPRKNEIWSPRQVRTMEAESESKRMGCSPRQELRLGVLWTNPCHKGRAF